MMCIIYVLYALLIIMLLCSCTCGHVQLHAFYVGRGIAGYTSATIIALVKAPSTNFKRLCMALSIQIRHHM